MNRPVTRDHQAKETEVDDEVPDIDASIPIKANKNTMKAVTDFLLDESMRRSLQGYRMELFDDIIFIYEVPTAVHDLTRVNIDQQIGSDNSIISGTLTRPLHSYGSQTLTYPNQVGEADCSFLNSFIPANYLLRDINGPRYCSIMVEVGVSESYKSIQRQALQYLRSPATNLVISFKFIRRQSDKKVTGMLAILHYRDDANLNGDDFPARQVISFGSTLHPDTATCCWLSFVISAFNSKILLELVDTM